MLKELLEERDYLPVVKMKDGTPVTLQNFEERRREMIDCLRSIPTAELPKNPQSFGVK